MRCVHSETRQMTLWPDYWCHIGLSCWGFAFL